MYKEQQRGNAWESTVRKTQLLQQHQSGRRRGCIFAPMSVAPDDDAGADATASSTPTSTGEGGEEEEEEVYHAERLLPNGDFYTGQWWGSVPHGTGKYLWTDGCMYEGEWRQGKTMGKARFSWPSGATYEGEFKSGFMDGFGTYTGSSGDTYRGHWSMNLKHGLGRKSYANGDCYDGEWRAGVQEGHGRYTWKNGNEYVGQWRAGLIHGSGSLVWANGNRHDGGWEDGLPKGNGTFRWADGSLYIGVWSRDPASPVRQKGVYHPSPAATSPTVRDPREAFAAGLGDCKICPGETVSILPSQKTLNWSGIEADFLQKQAMGRSSKASDSACNAPRRHISVDTAGVPPRRPNRHTDSVVRINNNRGAGDRSFDRICIWESDGDITCDIVDGSTVMAAGGKERSDDMIAKQRLEAEPDPRMAMSPPQIRLTPRANRQGVTISKGHKNYELMLSLQLGIRYFFPIHQESYM